MASNPLDVLRRHITNIPSPLYVACWLGAEVASVVPTDVEADDLMAGCSQEWDEYRANVAAVTGDEHPHTSLLICWSSYEIRQPFKLSFNAESVPLRGQHTFGSSWSLQLGNIVIYWRTGVTLLHLPSRKITERSLESSRCTIPLRAGNGTSTILYGAYAILAI
jgi:hypothetical protein